MQTLADSIHTTFGPQVSARIGSPQRTARTAVLSSSHIPFSDAERHSDGLRNLTTLDDDEGNGVSSDAVVAAAQRHVRTASSNDSSCVGGDEPVQERTRTISLTLLNLVEKHTDTAAQAAAAKRYLDDKRNKLLAKLFLDEHFVTT